MNRVAPTAAIKLSLSWSLLRPVILTFVFTVQYIVITSFFSVKFNILHGFCIEYSVLLCFWNK